MKSWLSPLDVSAHIIQDICSWRMTSVSGCGLSPNNLNAVGIWFPKL